MSKFLDKSFNCIKHEIGLQGYKDNTKLFILKKNFRNSNRSYIIVGMFDE